MRLGCIDGIDLPRVQFEMKGRHGVLQGTLTHAQETRPHRPPAMATENGDVGESLF